MITVYDEFGNGKTYDDKTGLLVETVKPLYDSPTFNQNMAEALCSMVSLGSSITKACEELNLPYATYQMWKRTVPEFSNMIKLSREGRAETNREKLYEDELQPMMNVKASEIGDKKQLSIYKELLSVIEKKQDIIKKQNIVDNPEEKESGLSTIQFICDIPDEVEKKIEQIAKPSLTESGKIQLPNLRRLPDSSGEDKRDHPRRVSHSSDGDEKSHQANAPESKNEDGDAKADRRDGLPGRIWESVPIT